MGGLQYKFRRKENCVILELVHLFSNGGESVTSMFGNIKYVTISLLCVLKYVASWHHFYYSPVQNSENISIARTNRIKGIISAPGVLDPSTITPRGKINFEICQSICYLFFNKTCTQQKLLCQIVQAQINLSTVQSQVKSIYPKLGVRGWPWAAHRPESIAYYMTETLSHLMECTAFLCVLLTKSLFPEVHFQYYFIFGYSGKSEGKLNG